MMPITTRIRRPRRTLGRLLRAPIATIGKQTAHVHGEPPSPSK